MTREILWSAGLACLALTIACGSAYDAPALNAQLARAGDPNASPRPVNSANSPLPTQIWWTGRENNLLVNERGKNSVVEIDLAGKTVSSKTIDKFPGCVFAAPAPNRKLWASIDPRIPLVKIHDGDLLGSGPLATVASAIESIVIGANPQALAFTPDS